MGFGGIYIMMPVKVIDKQCKECAKLTIKGEWETLYADGKVISIENNLECSHLRSCLCARKILVGDTKPEAGEKDA